MDKYQNSPCDLGTERSIACQVIDQVAEGTARKRGPIGLTYESRNSQQDGIEKKENITEGLILPEQF